MTCACGCGEETKGGRYKRGHWAKSNSEQLWPTLEAYIMANVRREGDCLIWTGPQFSDGYGQAKWHDLHGRAHRIAYVLWNGPIPEGQLVCHSCDTPLCVERSHLWVGTQGDNQRDKWRKGRGFIVVTENHHSRKPRDEAGRFHSVGLL